MNPKAVHSVAANLICICIYVWFANLLCAYYIKIIHPDFTLSQLSFFIGFLFVHVKKCAIKGNHLRVAR